MPGFTFARRKFILTAFSDVEAVGGSNRGGGIGPNSRLTTIWTGGPEMISLRSTSKRSWGVRFRKGLQLLGGVMGVLLLCLPLFSQGTFGRILGTVTDQSGGVISGANVTVTDTERGVTKNLVSNDAGEFNAPNLVPGTYKVRVEAK